MKQKRLQIFIYLLADFLASWGMWLVFFYISKQILAEEATLKVFHIIAAFSIGVYWVFIYALAGLYLKPFRKSRIQELAQVFKYTFFGVLVIFFMVLLDDPVPPKYESLRITFTTYLGIQFGAIAFLRMLITTRTQIRIRKGIIGFPTLLIGSQKQAIEIYEELGNRRRSLGYEFLGFIPIPNSPSPIEEGSHKIPCLGELAQLETLLKSHRVEEVIIALEQDESQWIETIIHQCDKTNTNIKIVPGIYDYIVGSVKTYHILGAPLIEVFPQMMKTWEKVVKRLMDLVFSLIALLIFTPVYLIIAIAIKLNSSGPIFYLQERIGKGGKPFMIFKFRSMYIDAEEKGPSLTTDEDPRITPVGNFLRKIRLDELPQFLNVLRGDMSLVGPRPERKFFIDQIVQKAPQYRHLHKIRPGITSWGQVKYGYASNVDEMVERLTYDILYLENMSISLDIKIMLYTLIVVIEGRGK